MTEKERKLKLGSAQIRLETLKMLKWRGYGHLGGAMSIVELLSVLYNEVLKYDPERPNWADRDYVVLSKGHSGPSLYAALALHGFFDKEWLYTLNEGGTRLPSHPDRLKTPGVDATTGSLGQGTSVAAGLGMALRLEKKASDQRVYLIVGDGELNEGECWEAFMLASHYKLDNLCIMVDVNNLQIDGATGDVMSTEPLDQKMDAFGFNTIVCNGNSMTELEQAFVLFERAHGSGKPTCFLLHTTKGLGVSYMENAVDWHGKGPNDDEYDKAMAELRQTYDLLEKEAQR